MHDEVHERGAWRVHEAVHVLADTSKPGTPGAFEPSHQKPKTPIEFLYIPAGPHAPPPGVEGVRSPAPVRVATPGPLVLNR